MMQLILRKIIFLAIGDKTKLKWVAYKVDAETEKDLKEMKSISGRPMKEFVIDAIKAWVRGRLDIENTRSGNQTSRSKYVKIGAFLNDEFDKKIEKGGWVKGGAVGLIIKAYITNEYKDEWGNMKIHKLLNERKEYRDRVDENLKDSIYRRYTKIIRDSIF